MSLVYDSLLLIRVFFSNESRLLISQTSIWMPDETLIKKKSNMMTWHFLIGKCKKGPKFPNWCPSSYPKSLKKKNPKDQSPTKKETEKIKTQTQLIIKLYKNMNSFAISLKIPPLLSLSPPPSAKLLNPNFSPFFLHTRKLLISVSWVCGFFF